MPEKPPKDLAALDVLLRKIDSDFVEEKIPIPSRPVRALQALSKHYGISIPFGPSANLPPELQENVYLSEATNAWYKRVYGELLKMDFSAGRIVTSIDGDLYSVLIPRIFGQVRFIVRREFLNHAQDPSKGPAISNVLQLVKGMTPAKAATLSDTTTRNLFDDFLVGFQAHYTMEANQENELIHIARGDIQTAVNNLMDQANRFGESKWASLQASEKALKAAIHLLGGKFRFSHNLSELCETLELLGVNFSWRSRIRLIQCTAGIRYGEESCSSESALAAHKASLQLILELKSGGVPFKDGIAFRGS